jgi:hypothetical protein
MARREVGHTGRSFVRFPYNHASIPASAPFPQKRGNMERLLLVAVLFTSIFAFSMCAQYAACPQDGETAALIESHNQDGGWVATYAHTHRGSDGQSYHHEFQKACN